VASWGSNGTGNGRFNTPIGIAVDSSGATVFVADNGNNRVQAFSPPGAYQSQWGESSSPGGNGILKGPEGVAVDSGGNIYVVDTNDNFVQVFH
jgi:DNA-binding beta-propeller fold protein YncE